MQPTVTCMSVTLLNILDIVTHSLITYLSSCNISRWFSFLNEVGRGQRKIGTQVTPRGIEPVASGLERISEGWLLGDWWLSWYRDQLAMAAKVRRHWLNPSMLGSQGHLDANFSLVLC